MQAAAGSSELDTLPQGSDDSHGLPFDTHHEIEKIPEAEREVGVPRDWGAPKGIIHVLVLPATIRSTEYSL
jgi:hypothetical protein